MYTAITPDGIGSTHVFHVSGRTVSPVAALRIADFTIADYPAIPAYSAASDPDNPDIHAVEWVVRDEYEPVLDE